MDERLVEFEANFSVLDRYGVDVTADTFITNPAIGRDNQIKELMLILLTPEKSAILIGKPGIGKTAIVEGLAYRMQRGEVPEALKGYTIINIKTASLLGTMPSGESKVQKMIDELKTREKVILFVDEIHMLIGATDSSSLDFANIFKEGLGRGSIKVIGATTTEEYERYILRDKAFTRRFQKVEVPEPSRDETVQIMMGTYPKFEKQTGRKLKYTAFIQERIMTFLVDITSEYKRVFALGSRYPDVCLTLLKQAFSYTVFDNREYVDIFDIRKAIENSKNIYPDVIKKELPRFDSEFNDIILEEKGEKKVEEWRREKGPTRYEMTNSILVDTGGSISSENGNKADVAASIFKHLEKTPDMVDKQKLKENRPVKTIMYDSTLQKFAKIGPTAISKGLKEKFNRKSDSSNIDNLLLSSKIGVISNNKDDNLDFRYTVTDELRPGGTNDLLLGAPISSTLDGVTPKEEEVVRTYKSDNFLERELDPNKNSLILNESSDINNNNRDNSGLLGTSGANKFFDKPLDIASSREQRNHDFNRGNLDEKRNVDNFDGVNNRGNNRLNNNGEFNKNMNINKDNVAVNSFNSNNIDNDSNPSIGVNQYENYNSKNSNTSLPSINTKSFLGEFGGDNGETLFGAPMYSVENKKENMYDGLVNNGIENNSFDTSIPIGNATDLSNNLFAQSVTSMNNNVDNETLFGAPMYSTTNASSIMDDANANKNVDIFGQLITDNMRIKEGKIVDEYAGLDKYGINVNSSIDKVSPSTNVVTDFYGNDIVKDNINNQMINSSSNFNEDNSDDSKKWQFIQSPEEEKKPQKVIFNELELPNMHNNVSSIENSSSGGFVNFNDLNAGRIPQSEVNNFVSLSNNRESGNNINTVEMNQRIDAPSSVSFDLNLENNEPKNDNYFDDFFDN